MIHTQHILFLSALLFSLGIMIVIVKQNAIMMLLGIELMLNASNVNLIAFNQLHPNSFEGHFFVLFVIIVAVCEAAVGLAIILRVYQYYHTTVPGEINQLKD